MTCQTSDYQQQASSPTGSSSAGGWVAMAIIAVMLAGFAYLKRVSCANSILNCLQNLPDPISSRVGRYQVNLLLYCVIVNCLKRVW